MKKVWACMLAGILLIGALSGCTDTQESRKEASKAESSASGNDSSQQEDSVPTDEMLELTFLCQRCV